MKINLRNKHSYKGEGIYIGRPSLLQNPFYITEERSRTEVIYDYAIYIKKEIKKESLKIISELERLLSILLDKGELNIICWCNPLPCHGDIIKQILLNKIYRDSWLIENKIGMEINGENI